MGVAPEGRARPAFLVAGLVAVAAALRLYGLGAPSLTVDEGMTAFVAFMSARSPGQVVDVIRQIGEVHPPGYFVLVQAWSGLGMAEAWLRLSSALPGILAIPATLWLGAEMRAERRLSPSLVAAGLLLATSAWHVSYSRELRMYPLLGLLVLVALAGFVRGGRFGWACFVLGSAGAAWVHYFGLFAPVLAGVWCLRHRRDRVVGWLAGTLAVWLLFLPWVPVLLGQFSAQNLQLRARPEATALLELLGRMTSADLFPSGTGLYLVLAAVPLVLAGLALRRGRGVDALLWLLIPPLTAWAVSTFTGLRVFEFKYFVWCAPFLALLEGEAFEPPSWWTRGVLGAVVGVHLVFWGLMVFHPMAENQDWRGVAREIRTELPEGAVALVQPSMMAAPLLYYGVQPNRLAPLDLPGDPRLDDHLRRMTVWLVTTPQHPLVQQSGLEPVLDARLLRLRGRERPADGAWLPSAVTRVVRYRGEPLGRAEEPARRGAR